MDRNSQHREEQFFSREKLKNDLKMKSVRGAINKILTNGSSIIISMATAVVLARLLTPGEFGLLAMVLVFTEFARLILEIGLGVSTVQREKITHEEISTLFWINLAIGIILMSALACFSPVIAWFYGEKSLKSICIVLSIVFLLQGSCVQQRALLERQMKFGYLGIINLSSMIFGAFVAIALAVKGSGVWALVWREITTNLVYAAGIWIFSKWTPGLPKMNTEVRSSLRFGLDILGASTVQYFIRNLDRLLIGKFINANTLGLYAKAFQFATMPVDNMKFVFWDIGFSPLSAFQNEIERYRNVFRRLLLIQSFFYMPVVVFLTMQSKEIILLLFGEAWINAVPFFRIFVVAGFVRPIMYTIKLVMISTGNTRRNLWWVTIEGVCMILSYICGIQWGAIGVAYGVALASYALLLLSFWFCLKRTPVNGILVIRSIFLPMMSSAGSGVLLFLILKGMPILNIYESIIMSISIIFISYLGIWLCIPNGRENLKEFWSYRLEYFNRRKPIQSSSQPSCSGD